MTDDTLSVDTRAGVMPARPVLHGYQHEAVEFLRSHAFGALFLDMGLG